MPEKWKKGNREREREYAKSEQTKWNVRRKDATTFSLVGETHTHIYTYVYIHIYVYII